MNERFATLGRCLGVLLALCGAVAANSAKPVPVAQFEPDTDAPGLGLLQGSTWVGDEATWKIWIRLG